MIIKNNLNKFLNLPLRQKIILSFLAVISLGGLLTLTFGTRLEHRTIISLAQAKVQHDLASAWMVYNEKLSDIRDIVRINSSRESVQNSLKNTDRETLSKYLGRIRKDFGLDVLTLTDAQGNVFLRTSQSTLSGDPQVHDPLVRRALNGEIVAATQIVPREELLKEHSDLAAQAYLDIIPTPKAAPSLKKHEKDGMMLKAAAPLIDEDKRIIGVLYGGILLNRNYEIVDRVKEIVFKGEKYKGREIGTATIFQHDLRISTNVKKENGDRAIGTRVSQEVNQAVLKEGTPWIHRAFVVNDWYIAAYEPIKNIDNAIIGILYVGMLEKPYIDLRNRVMVTFTGIAVLCVVILLVILFFVTSTIIRPIQNLVFATNKIARGDMNHRVDIHFQDEVGQLAQSFNQMTEALKTANQKLIHWGKTLEKRVEARTKELRDMQDSMVQSEKMASLGKIAAGVAHEINNPLTSILINTHLMMEKTSKESPFQENLKMIAEETSRCSDIVKGLLEFSRQSPPQKSYVDINTLVTTVIGILEKQAALKNIKILKALSADLPLLEVDANKIKQVFWNLIINAVEAMPKGGTLKIQSRLSQSEGFVEVEFSDTGVGISDEQKKKLFDPFFTTKGGGTGLGLAVSYGIIEQHQGKIEVKSQLSQGSSFTVSLPVKGT